VNESGGSSSQDPPGSGSLDDFLKAVAASPSATLPSASPHPREDPQSLAHFKILDRVGEGGMGIVYRAQDEKLGRVVALKVLPPGFAADDARRKRFTREARLAAAVQHPNLVTVYELGEAQGRVYIAMEFVQGRTLRAWLQEGPPALSVALRVFAQIVTGVAEAHQAGIVHRDLKPENVLVTDHESAKVLDFGLAKPPETETTFVTATEERGPMGTPAYMSPEQVHGGPVTPASDVFALGVMLYELLTGERPYRGKSMPQLIRSLERDVPVAPSVRNPSVPRAFDGVVSVCIARDPSRRYPDAAGLLAELQALPRLP
jgi:eukaryotic-like serine/threonine-protein kinase